MLATPKRAAESADAEPDGASLRDRRRPALKGYDERGDEGVGGDWSASLGKRHQRAEQICAARRRRAGTRERRRAAHQECRGASRHRVTECGYGLVRPRQASSGCASGLASGLASELISWAHRAHQSSSGLIRAHQGSSVGLIRAHRGSSGLIGAHRLGFNGLAPEGRLPSGVGWLRQHRREHTQRRLRREWLGRTGWRRADAGRLAAQRRVERLEGG